ncbi:hypothetical protein FOZ61_009262, partial [Perkinsus olseni]
SAVPVRGVSADHPTAFFGFSDVKASLRQGADLGRNGKPKGSGPSDGADDNPNSNGSEQSQQQGTHASYNEHPRDVEGLDPDTWLAAYNFKWYMMWGSIAAALSIACYFKIIVVAGNPRDILVKSAGDGDTRVDRRGADPEGAKEITMTWKSHKPNPVSETNVLDFRSLNKSAIDDGKCRTASDQKIYREQHPKFLVHKSASQKRQEGSSVAPRHEKPMPSNFVYGKKTRPSTPISHVISNQFGLESEMVVEAQYEKMVEAEEKAKSHCQLKIKSTRAAKGHAAVGKSAHQKHTVGEGKRTELFKLSKFKTVPARCYLPKVAKNVVSEVLVVDGKEESKPEEKAEVGSDRGEEEAT